MKRRKKVDPWLDGSIPLTQDYADAVFSLLSAADLASDLSDERIKSLCLREARLILLRGALDVTAPKAPSEGSVRLLKDPPADCSPGSERK